MAGQYRFKDSNGNIVAQISASVEGAIAFSGSVVDFTQANNVILGNVQLAGTASNALLLDGFDSQAFAFTSSIHPFTASTNTRLDSIETISASNISRLNSLEEKTGSLATTGSNIFYGQQTFSGSLYVQNDLIVQGSSSLQNITASAVSIGTNIVYLNTDTPAVRYAGLTVQDSGSSAGITGSILWDSLCNKWIYSNPSTVGYSGGMLISGPRTSNLGEEIGTTACSLMVGQGGDHISSSTLFHYQNATCFYGTSYIKSTGGAYYSGNVGIGTENAVANLTLKENESCKALVLYGRTSDNLARIDFYRADETCFAGRIQIDNGTTSNLSVRAQGALQFQTGGSTNRLIIDNVGIATFSNKICSVGAILTSDLQINGTSSGKIVAFTNYSNNNVGLSLYNTAGTEVIYLNGNSGGIGATTIQSTYFSGTCLTLNGFSSGNGFKMDYGSASGQITAINLMANGTTNGFIGIQMVDGSNGDLWFGSSANRSMTVYRTTGHVGFGIDAPCTRVHAEGGYGSRWGGNGCFYGGGVSGGGMPYGDIYGNGASYTYQTCNTNANNSSLWGGFAAGYFKGGPGSAYGGGGAGIVAIGGNGGNAESVNAGGGAGIFARGGKNGAGSVHSYAAWFDGGDVMVRCGFLGVNNTAPRTFVHIVGASCGADIACGFGNADARGTLHVEACSGFQNSNITVENAYGIGQFMQWTSQGMRIGHRILKGGSPGDVHMTAGQDSVKLLIYANGNLGAPSGSNIYNASDCRLKKNIRTISYGLCDVMKLQPKVFNWKDNFTPSENGKEMLGFIAQDVQPIVPEVVEQFSDGSDITFDCETISNPLRVNEKFIIPILTKAIQEQQCMIDTLKSCLGIS